MTEEARISTRASADEERVPSKSARVSTMGWLSFFTMFAIGTDTFLVAPLLPLLQRELDVPLSRAGWLVSAYALGYALFALVAGPVSDRHDRRRVILSGLYRNDLAERFSFTGVRNWEVIPGIPDAAAAIKAEGSEDLYVVTCFSDRDKLLNLPDVKKEG